MNTPKSHKRLGTFSRRNLLAGLGAGTALLAPVVGRIASAADEKIRRFVIVLEGNGFEPVTMLGDSARAAINKTLGDDPLADNARWWSSAYKHEELLEVDVMDDLKTAKALSPLAAGPGADSLIDKAAVILGLSSRVSGGGHSAEHGALSSSRSVGGVPGGPTIDSVLGAFPAVRGETPYDVLRLGVGTDPGRPVDFMTCAYDKGKAAPMLLQPHAALAALFGSVGDKLQKAEFARRGELLDYALADVAEALKPLKAGSEPRAKLEAYRASLTLLKQRQTTMLGLENELSEALATAAPQLPDLESDNLELKGPLATFAAQMDIATAALIGGLTRVCVIGCATGNDFNVTYPPSVFVIDKAQDGEVKESVDESVRRHDLEHISSEDPHAVLALHKATRSQVTAIAKMARLLASTPEPGGNGGTMLDNTVIVYVGDNGEQHHSTGTEFPVLLIGGEKMGLKTGGRTLVYPGISSGKHRQLSNLWNTLGHLAGHTELNEFGTEGATRMATGALTELMDG